MLDLIVHWDVDPILFDFGYLKLRWYGLLFASGYLAAHLVLQRVFKWETRPQKDLDTYTIMMMIYGVVGGRLGHCYFYEPEVYLSEPIRVLQIWEGGIASHGAAIGLLLGTLHFISIRREYKFSWIADRLTLVVPLTSVFIRTGNLMNSEIFGYPTSLPWGFVYERINPDMAPRHPTQIYEAATYGLLFLFLFWVYRVRCRKQPPAGLITGLFLTLFFTARFLIEFLKENQVAFEQNIPLKMGQWLSLPLILAGIATLVWVWKRGQQGGLTAS